MPINVIQHDDRLCYLRLFYNGAFSIASKNDLDDQNLLLATVHEEIFEKKKILKLEKINFITNKNKSKNQVGKSNSQMLLSISFVCVICFTKPFRKSLI
jgi:hypothetical protein